MKKSIVIMLSFAILLAALFAFDVNNITGNYVKYRTEDLERKSDKTEVFFYQDPAPRGSSMNVKIVPGGRGIRKRIDIFKVQGGNDVMLRSINFCTQPVCTRGRIYDIFISKAYSPGTYKLVFNDLNYGRMESYFHIE